MSDSYLGKTGALCKREFDQGERRRWRSPLFREFDLAERPIKRDEREIKRYGRAILVIAYSSDGL
ncbi:MAG: hypothetical protein EB015_22805 [Methylocystaceae bacterium]|nr:hypothetical protein [Methylocystaceae bacterium]